MKQPENAFQSHVPREKTSSTQQEFLFETARFNGPDYVEEFDADRLQGQIKAVYDCMKDGNWRTLFEIEVIINAPQASISAQLRHLRKKRFGGHTINKRRRGDEKHGWFEYQLVVRNPANNETIKFVK